MKLIFKINAMDEKKHFLVISNVKFLTIDCDSNFLSIFLKHEALRGFGQSILATTPLVCIRKDRNWSGVLIVS